TVTVDPTADTAIEADETVALTLVAGAGYTIGTTAAVVGTIRNDDFPVITLAVAPVTVTEDGITNLIYTFTRTSPTAAALSVNYAVGGTAILGTDYTGIAATPATKTVSFAAGSATATVTVDPTADTTIEADETVALTLVAGTGYTIGTTAVVVGTISNDDFPVITLAVAPVTVTEDGTTNLAYTLTRTGPTTGELTVNYGITGTADASDYTGATPGVGKTIVFAASSATATLIIDPTADTTIEADETVSLTLAAGTGYTVGTTTAVTGTITNDDTSLTLYSASTSSLPSQQGWLSFGSGLTGTQMLTSNGTTLSSTAQVADRAGYSNHTVTAANLVNSAFPKLDRSVGFGLDFRLQVLSESHQTNNRAGCSLILLDQGPTPRGIELGFWSNSIFSQAGGSTPFQTIAERVDGVNTSQATTYSLRILDQRYYLLAGNSLLLSGSVQDYSLWPKDPIIPYGPYKIPNFLFLGDNTSSAKASVELGTISLVLPLSGTNASDTFSGTSAADLFTGLAGADLLIGNGGADWLAGGAGADTLDGGTGDDLLIGGSEADCFRFSTGAPFNASDLGVDIIVDFNPTDDRLRLARATFAALPTGSNLAATAFAVVSSDGAAALSTATIVYNSANGGLFYNPNGSAVDFAGTLTGGGKFAQLCGATSGAPFPVLTSTVFEIV
ncbi:MAG: Calx-beta domain-containing protein, partial [Cyanobium sp.]